MGGTVSADVASILDLVSILTFQQPTARPWVCAAVTIWLAAVSSGLWIVWAYENAPGARAHAPETWPAASALVPAHDRPTVLFVAHPHCTCTRASLDELAEVLARAEHRAKTYVVFLRPTQFERGWEQSELWRRAAALPDVVVLRDDDGAEARRFGVETSGQTLLYDARGALIFSGGITGARGHAGENAGAAAVTALLTRGAGAQRGADVFGCPLFAAGE